MNEKSFILFGCGQNIELREKAIKAVERMYRKRGAVAIHFNPTIHVKPDALLYVSRSLFLDVYYITKLNGKAVCSFEF